MTSCMPCKRSPAELMPRDGIAGNCTRNSTLRTSRDPVSLRPQEADAESRTQFRVLQGPVPSHGHRQIGLARFALAASALRQVAPRSKQPLTHRNPLITLDPKHDYCVNHSKEKNRNNCLDQEVHVLILPKSSQPDLHWQPRAPEARALLTCAMARSLTGVLVTDTLGQHHPAFLITFLRCAQVGIKPTLPAIRKAEDSHPKQ